MCEYFKNQHIKYLLLLFFRWITEDRISNLITIETDIKKAGK